MIRIFLAIAFLLAGQNLMAETVQQMSLKVDQLTKAYADDLDETDRRAVRRRLQVILDIYEDAGFNLNTTEFLCGGRTLYTKEGHRVLTTSDSEQCLFNVDMTKKGSLFLCGGRTNYDKSGNRVLTTSDRAQCHSNMEFSSQGSKFLCGGRTFYDDKGNRIVTTADAKQCTTNLQAVGFGSDRICGGRTLYDLKGNRILTMSSREECEDQILL